MAEGRVIWSVEGGGRGRGIRTKPCTTRVLAQIGEYRVGESLLYYEKRREGRKILKNVSTNSSSRIVCMAGGYSQVVIRVRKGGGEGSKSKKGNVRYCNKAGKGEGDQAVFPCLGLPTEEG